MNQPTNQPEPSPPANQISAGGTTTAGTATSLVAGARLWVILTSLAAAAAVSQSFGRFTYSLLFTDIRDDFGLSNTVAGAIGSLNLLAYLAGSVLVSVTVVRLGMGLTAKLGLAGVIIALALLVWSPNTGLVTAALVLSGLAAAGVWVTAPGIATEALGQARRAEAAGWTTGGVGVGLVAISAFDALIDESRWRAIYLVEVLIGIVALAALVLSVRRIGARQSSASQTSASPPDASPSGAAPAAASAERASRFAAAVRSLKSVPAWGLATTIYSVYAAVVSLALTFTVALLTEDASLSSGQAAAAFAMIGVGSMFGGLALGRTADRIGNRRGGAISLFITIVGVSATATGNFPAALAGSLLLGFAFTGAISAMVAHLSGHLDGSAFGEAYGLVTVVFGAGLTVGPQVGGLLADWQDSFRPAFYLAIALCVLCLLANGWGNDPATSADKLPLGGGS